MDYVFSTIRDFIKLLLCRTNFSKSLAPSLTRLKMSPRRQVKIPRSYSIEPEVGTVGKCHLKIQTNAIMFEFEKWLIIICLVPSFLVNNK